MDNNKEWYVFMKEADMSINDGVDMKIISHLELKFQTEVVAMTILTVVAWIVNAFNLSNGKTNSLTELVPQKERRQQELLLYLVHTERCRDIIRIGLKAFIHLCQRLRKIGYVKDAFRSTVEEQVTKFLHIIGHNVKNRTVSFFFIGLVKHFLAIFIMYLTQY